LFNEMFDRLSVIIIIVIIIVVVVVDIHGIDLYRPSRNLSHPSVRSNITCPVTMFVFRTRIVQGKDCQILNVYEKGCNDRIIKQQN
jgi:hypothetical protein